MEISLKKILQNSIVLFAVCIVLTLLGILFSQILFGIGCTLSILALILLIRNSRNFFVAKKQYNLSEEVVSNGTAKAFYKDSTKLHKTISLVNGVRHGDYKEYHENGNIKVSVNYDSGKYHGPYLEFYSNGNIAFETYYNLGIQTGETKLYYKYGQLFREVKLGDNSEYLDVSEYRLNGKLKFTCKYDRISFYNFSGKLSCELFISMPSQYKFSNYSSDWNHFLTHCAPTASWLDYNENGTVRNSYQFVSGFQSDKSGFQQVNITSNVGTHSESSILANCKISKGFHVNFISDLARSRMTKEHFQFNTTMKGPPGAYNGFKVAYYDICSISDVLQIY